MASIERTAYPRLKQKFSKSELHDFYTPSWEEIFFVRETARNDEPQLHLLVQLKTFQRLGYFPNLEDVPESLISHLRSELQVSRNVLPLVTKRTLYKHHQAVRLRLNVRTYDRAARKMIVRVVFTAAQTMDNPADLINAAIEELIKERYELPAFSTLDRLTGRVRNLVNRRLYQALFRRLSPTQISTLDKILQPDEKSFRTPYNSLKELPKKATLKHLQELIAHLESLTGLGDYEEILQGVSPVKIKHFAAQAKALDAAEMKDFADAKRYALLVCFVTRAGIKARDALAEMFIKRMAKLHQNGKEELEKIKLRQTEKTERLVSLFSGVLANVDLEKSDAEVGKNIKKFFGSQNLALLMEECEIVSAYYGDNYFPLIWKFYRSHRSALLRLITALKFSSTTNDRSLIDSLKFLIESENRRGDYLEAADDLTFAGEKWRRMVLKTIDWLPVFDRKHFEVCVFSHLAQELKSGDIAIEGSEEYADYRNQLLDWEECQPLVSDFCTEIGLPETSADFIKQLKEELKNTAARVDKNYPKNAALTIDEKGDLVLKKIVAKEASPRARALEIAVTERMPERNLLDVLSNVQFHTELTRHFGPFSGSDPKLERPVERYLLTLFTYGCNLGPAQAARHMRGLVSSHMLSFVNQRHMNAKKLDSALVDLLNSYHRFRLPKFWGDGSHASADGTKYDLSEQNLKAEYHIRYGGYGGIAYHHVSDLYVALFSHFINCGTWEAVYIIDGLLKNESEIQPKEIKASWQFTSNFQSLKH